MRKILLSVLALGCASGYAMENSAFQAFDDQYNIGFGMSQTNVISPGSLPSTAQVTNQSINVDAERLFDVGVWMDVQANFAISSVRNQPYGIGASGDTGSNALNQGFNLGGLNAKVGYAFTLADQHIQITPYALGGINTNWSSSTVAANGGANLTQDYFYTGGVGARLEYRINNAVLVYADQNGTYNWDQSAPLGGIQPQNNTALTSTLGAKFNVVKNLQLGVNGFYNYYQPQGTVPTFNGQKVYTPQDAFGGVVSVGLTY